MKSDLKGISAMPHLEFNVPLRKFTTFGVGGMAKIFSRPESAEELAEMLDLCRREGLPHYVIGGGSNILFDDAGFEGMIIKLGTSFEHIKLDGGGYVRSGASVASARLLDTTVEAKLTGLECLTGIPGTIGGAVKMNAGCGGGGVGDAVDKVRLVDADGSLKVLNRDDLGFEYRKASGLDDGGIILEIGFVLVEDSGEAIKSRVREMIMQRGNSQPKGFRSAGSVFKNPIGFSAGKLIDECGLKGRSVGGAAVSDVHANFIVSRGQASGRDILELMKIIIETVRQRHGLTLEPEIKIVGPQGEVGSDGLI